MEPLSLSSVNELISLWMRKTHEPYAEAWREIEMSPGSFTPRSMLLVINTLDSSRTSVGDESWLSET